MEQNWYNCDAEETLKRLGSSKKGLTEQAAAAGLREHGANVLGEEKSRRRLLCFWRSSATL